MKITPNFIDNLDYADIVRGSYEDFLTLYKKDNSDKVYNAEISFYCRNFIYTHGAEPVEVYGNGGFSKHYDVRLRRPSPPSALATTSMPASSSGL